MSNTGDTISIDDLEYAIIPTKPGHCDNCAFYVFNEDLQLLDPCPRPALQLCIQSGCIFNLNSNKI